MVKFECPKCGKIRNDLCKSCGRHLVGAKCEGCDMSYREAMRSAAAERASKFAELRDKVGLTTKEIAQTAGIGSQRVSQILKRYGY